MRFEDAYEGWQGKRLTQEQAAQLLGVCERSFRRYIDRYEEAGLEGLMDKRFRCTWPCPSVATRRGSFCRLRWRFPSLSPSPRVPSRSISDTVDCNNTVC